MLSCCFNCRKNIESKNSMVEKTKKWINNALIKLCGLRQQKVYSSLIDDICGADLADMQLINKFNKGFQYLLCVIDIAVL